MRAESNLQELLPAVNQAVDGVLRRRRKGKDFADDFRGWVMLKMLERDGAILKQFRGESAIGTYLRVVVDRLYCDYLSSLNGKWRPSKMAMRLGLKWVELERLIYRDGYTLDQAIASLGTREGHVIEAELRDGFARLPSRGSRFFVDLDSHAELQEDPRYSADSNLRQMEIDRASSMIRESLKNALAELPKEDLQLLELRFRRGARISDLSRELGRNQRCVYAHLYRILRVLRKQLEARGVHRNMVTEMTEGGSVSQEIEGAFAAVMGRIPCVSNSGKGEVTLEPGPQPVFREAVRAEAITQAFSHSFG